MLLQCRHLAACTRWRFALASSPAIQRDRGWGRNDAQGNEADRQAMGAMSGDIGAGDELRAACMGSIGGRVQAAAG